MIFLRYTAGVVLALILVACQSKKIEPASFNGQSLQNVTDARIKPEFQPVCLNKAESTTAFVYLHGVDMATVSDQEKKNREKLLRIAQKLHISVVVPRAISICPKNPDQICWGWAFDKSERSQTLERITSAVETCGAKKVIALVGFSNGGYAVNSLHLNCEADVFGKLISIGALFNIPGVTLKYNQGCAGQMVRLIGKQDSANSNPAAFKYVTDHKLENLIQVTVFDGGHEIPEALLLDLLQSRLKEIN